MTTKERRESILKKLAASDSPLSASALAKQFGVSRQVIVQDVAVLREKQPEIISTYRGYIIEKEPYYLREFKVCHGSDQISEELSIIVDCGAQVRNISISHRVYGRVSAEMNISSRIDIEEFVGLLEGSKSKPLSDATSGYHYHLVAAPSIERLDLVEKKLGEAGFLAPLKPWETNKETA